MERVVVGKTTISTSFIKYAQKNLKDKKIIAVDGDVNTHLGKALDMKQIFLGDRINEMGYYFESKRGANVIIGTTPPDYSTKFIKADLNDEFFKKFASKKDNTVLITVGSYTEEGMGADCYHSKLGASELIYNRLLDDQDTLVITDGTAGVDSVGTSIFLVSDVNIFVVEPTSKSIEIFETFEYLTREYNLNNYVVINKAEDKEDIEFIESRIPKEKILAVVPYSKHLRKFEQGKRESLNDFVTELEEVNAEIYSKIKDTKRDWELYRKRMNNIYRRSCEEWYSQYYNEDLVKYINPEFSYLKVIEEINK